ncbi:MAG: plasmid recombination protein [Bacilli bacterium]|nr:plasmid recombination protein [Bacilli bacterium]
MNLNYAIFRSQPIMTLEDLKQIGSHNKREKQAYKSNPDIKLNMSQYNVELVPLAEKYVKGFYNITKDYRKEHEERMKTEREDRKRKFNTMLDNSRNVVADELLFTATNRFFRNMSNEDLMKWANTCMEFIYEDLGYTKEQILHSTLHLDEKTPHIHCVVVPLVKKLDKRSNTERYTISKKQFIKDKFHLSQLQDKYHQRLTEKGFDLERGIKGSDNVNINIKELKKITKKLNLDLNNKTQRLSDSVKDLQEKMQSNKNVFFDKEYVKIKKDTFDSMNKVIDDATNVMNLQPKLEKVYKEVDSYTKSYQSLKRENTLYENEIKALEFNNNKLDEENQKLIKRINGILKAIKKFFRKLLQLGGEVIKQATVGEIKQYFDDKIFKKKDVVNISVDTTKEDELFDYVGYERYYGVPKNNELDDDYEYNKNKDDDFEMTL